MSTLTQFPKTILNETTDQISITQTFIQNKMAKIKKNYKSKYDEYTIAKKLNPSLFKPFQWSIKCFIDFTAAFIGLILISPLLILIAILIKLDSPGPILFKQKRIGLNGKVFEMYKFRSMYTNSEAKLKELKKHNESNSVMFKMKNDPRITKIGQFIRTYSIDELPQLFNVLKKEMSLVGPRPPLVSEIEKYDDWHYARLASLPGLTGLWQVNGREKIQNFDQVVELDVFYIRNWDFLFDIKILLKTIPVVLFGKAC